MSTMTVKNVSGKNSFFGYGDPGFYLNDGASLAGLPYSLAYNTQFAKDLEAGVIEVTAGSPMINFKNTSALAKYFGYAPGGEFLAPTVALDDGVPVESGLSGVLGIADNPYFVADVGSGAIGDVATITSSTGANGTIVPLGATVLQMGDDQLYTITPSAHYHIASLLVDGVGVPLVSPYHFEDVKANHTIASTFSIDTYVATFVLGTGTRTGGGALVQTINWNASALAPTLTPASHKLFNSWDRTLVITATATINAVYDNAWYLVYSAGANGSIVGTASQAIVAGQDGTTVTATAAAHYHFLAWSDAYPTAIRKDLAVSADITAAASFTIDTYTLTYSVGSHGSIVGTTPQTVNWNANGTEVTATPDAHYHFTTWSDAYPTAIRQDLAVAANVTATASFAIDTYTLTYTAGAGGSVVGTTPQTVNWNANGTEVVATPDLGYRFRQWSDAVMTAARTELAVAANVTVSSSFIRIWTLTMAKGTGTGDITPVAGTSTVDDGVPQAITATALNFVNWTVTGGATVADANAASTTATLTADGSVTANWTV